MKKLMILAAAGVTLALAACDEPYQDQTETAPVEVESPVAPAATDETAPVVDPAAPDPTLETPLVPPEEKSSEQSVQPESETLFY